MKNVFLMPVFVAMVLTGCVSRHEIYKHPPTALVQQVGALAPLVEAYVLENQAIALKEGIPLAASQMAMAQEMGILRARDVRILYVEKLPFPSDPVLATAAKKYRYDPSAMVGYAYGHGIWIANGVKNDPTVLTHELIHVRQMEQTGLREHIRLYLTQLVVFGYREAPIEIEAYQEAERLR